MAKRQNNRAADGGNASGKPGAEHITVTTATVVSETIRGEHPAHDYF